MHSVATLTHLASVSTEVDKRRLASLRETLEPLEIFLKDPRTLDIMLNADGSIWVDRVGLGMSRTDLSFAPSEAAMMLTTVAAYADSELGPRCPSLQAQLPFWGYRLQALVPPVVTAPVFAIRKPASMVFTLEHYAERGILPAHLELAPVASRSFADRWRQATRGRTLTSVEKLELAVAMNANILIGGSPQAGKSTIANAILEKITARGGRPFLIEDEPRELVCSAENQVSVCIAPRVGFDWQQAVKASLRFRPDRIIVGEVRDGPAALELIKAWNTGNSGGLATIHADGPEMMLERVCQLVEEKVERAPRRFIAETVNVVIHIVKDHDHPQGRRVSGIGLVEGADDECWQLSSL
jgi:Flp pilus assembly CpaF family ATPase